MGRANSQNTYAKDGLKIGTWRRDCPTRHEATAPTLNVDVHVAAVFVVYPLAQRALGQ